MAGKLLISHYEKQKPSSEGFVVIGAGLPRTGTSSLRMALSKLLDGGCYHMADVFQGSEVDWDHWDKAMNDQKNKTRTLSKQDWVNFFDHKGYRAGVDYPVSNFYRELMEAYPDAKVILSVRDNPEGWYKSVKESIFKTKPLNSDFAVAIFQSLVGFRRAALTSEKLSSHPPIGFEKGMFGVVESGLEESVEFYNRWVEEVKQTVPKERLLVFNVKQGWKPLCDFLGVPVPPGDFPFENETKVFLGVFRKVRIMSYSLVYGLPIALATIGYVFRDNLINLLPF